MNEFEVEFKRVKSCLERFGNTIVNKFADEIVERLRQEGIDVVVKESDEFQPIKWNNIYNFGSTKYIHNKVIERVKNENEIHC